jgi:hypothetical protein
MRPLILALAVAGLLLFGCLGGNNSGAGAVITSEGNDAKDVKEIEVPSDSLFSLPSSVTSDATPAAGDATPEPTAKATPKPTAKPTATPEPTAAPTPAPDFPPRIQPVGSLTGTYYATCIHPELPSCGEFFTRLVTAGMTFYNPEIKEHKKDRRYFFFTTNDWTGAIRITQEMNDKYSPSDNTMGVFGYGSTISYPS